MSAPALAALLMIASPAPAAPTPYATIEGRAMASDLAALLSAPCATTRRANGIAGLSADEVGRRFGAPISKARFRLGDRDDEFRIGLRNVHPAGRPGADDVMIEELTWEREGCRLTIWLHEQGGRLVVADHLIYPADAEF